MDGRFVAYYRVSTQKQGDSGLGLDAQKRSVREFLNGGSWELVGEFEEVESGKHADRPNLRSALELCGLTGSRLVIAKLDRLTRDLHFLTCLQRDSVDFVACDMPSANKFTIQVMVAVAEQEREAITTRTRAALQSINARIERGEAYVSKRSGRPVTRLGNPAGLAVSRPDLGAQANRARADAFCSRVGPLIDRLRSQHGTYSSIAKELNAMKVLTARGGEWRPIQVQRVIERRSSSPQ